MRLLAHLPADWREATLVGRIATAAGPTPVVISRGRVRDVSRSAATVSDLLNDWNGAVPDGEDLGPLEQLPLAASFNGTDSSMRLLAPVDLQCVKACGVTFAVSAVERVIEERARGDYAKAQSIRDALGERVGADIRSVKPGSATAQRLKEALIADGLWSQYLEVAIGPDAEVFTKAPVLSSVGWGDWIGVRKESQWNNPEPEIVLACDAKGRTLGATLGNDVNLRDIEGRSALLLGKAKDNNASCAIGPFVRFFDRDFTLDDVRKMEISLEVKGPEGFVLHGASSLTQISRDPADIVGQTINENHQYPDGFVLFLGTMFAPIQDRAAKGQGFTHVEGDLVTVATPKLGRLTNRMRHSGDCEPWKFGLTELFAALMRRKGVG
jgi:fumarylacetoacetate (FAA) hydrolase family protein